MEKIRNIQTSVKNLNVIRQTNQGLGASRNIGLKSARGEYVWMIDGDDFLEPNIINIIVENIKKNNDIYCLNFNVTNENGNVLYKAYPDNYIKKTLDGPEYYSINYEKNYTWQYIFKKQLFIENDIWFKERINMQDSEILPKILYHTKTVRYLDVLGYNYVQYHNSFTNTQNPDKRYNYFKSIIEVRDSLGKFADSIKDSEDLYNTIQKKIESLNDVIFRHLVFYKYKKKDFRKNIGLLKNAGLYPLKSNVNGKMKFIKCAINNLPTITNIFLNLAKKQ
ncbi:glycosyltransferase involved in cell wall biosynthesis [Epilithonimonas hungarica]|nr:glycosyltransferase involved in cell wall biosynthesis [Epilithonimonas hungarica]